VTYTLHPKVEDDLDQAAEYLAKHASSRTVVRFFAEFERVMALIALHSDIGTPMSRGRRTHPLRIFRYSVVYRMVNAAPRVLAVRHKRRRPSYGGARR
jgi:plasmid stabilization system protein ParE